MHKAKTENLFIGQLACLGLLVLGITFLDAGYSQSATFFINVTAIGEATALVNPIAVFIGSALGSIVVIAKLIGIIKGHLQRRRWNKKYGESQTPVVINASGS